MRSNYSPKHLLHIATDPALVASSLKASRKIFKLTIANSQVEYEELLKSASFDLILYEDESGGFKCREALRFIRDSRIQTPFIIVSSLENEDEALETAKEGGSDYVTKDNLKRLPLAIDNAIKISRYVKTKKIALQESENSGSYRDRTNTELELAHQRIKKCETEMAQVQAISKMGSWETDLQTMDVAWSPQTYQLFELEDSRPNITHDKFLNYVHPADKEIVDKGFVSSFGTDGNNSIEHRIITKNGNIKYVEECWQFRYNEKREAVKAVGTIQDITVSKTASLLVMESEAKYRSLIESSMDAILLTVKTGEILAANLAACIYFKMSEEELLQSKRGEIVDTNDPRFLRLFQERDLTGRARGELTFIRKDKSVFPGEISSVVFTNAAGEERIANTIRDVSSRKSFEEKLLNSAKDLKDALDGINKIMDSSVDIICAVDADGKFIKVSAACKRIWGYEPAELIGKQLINFVHPDDAVATLDTSERVMSGELVSHFENRYIRKDGSAVFMEWTARWDEKEKLRYGIARDVTEKKKLETAIEMERKRFEGLHLQAPSCMVILKGPEYVYEVANPLYMQLIGRFDIIGKKLRDVLPELSTQGNFQILDEVYKSGNSHAGNETLFQLDVNGNGILVDKYLNFIYQPHINTNNEIDGIFFFAVDVTEQVNSRKTLDESQKKYKQIVEMAQEGIWVMDENNVTTFVNQKMSDILGYSVDEIIGKDIFFFMDQRGQAKAKELLKEKETVGIQQFYYRLISKEGKQIWAHISSNPLFNSEGVYAGAMAMLTDITEVKRAQEMLNRSEYRYRTLFEQNLAGFYQSTLDGVIINCNYAFAKMLKYDSPEEVMSVNASSLYFTEQDRKHFIANVIGNKKLYNYEGVSKCKDGTALYFLENVSVHTDPESGIEYFDGIMIDISEKKAAELKLQESNERFIKVSKATFDVIWDWNIKQDELYLGDRFEELFGHSMLAKKVGLKAWSAHIHPLDKERVLKNIDSKISGEDEAAWVEEYRYVCSDGHVAHVLHRGMFNKNGSSHIVGAMQDITEIKELENLLRKATSLAHIGSWEYNPLTTKLYWSDVVKEIHEVEQSFQPALESSLQFCVSAEDIDFLHTTLQDSITHGDFFDEEIEILTAKNKQKWIRINGEAEFMDGTCIKVYGSIQDITERKLSEVNVIKALVEKNTILESIGDAFFAVDHDWRVTYWNNQAEAILFKSKRETIGNNLWEVFHESINSESYKKYHEAVAGNCVIHFEDYYSVLNRWYEISAYPSESGLSVYIKDITSRKQTDEAVRASEEVRQLIMDAAMDAIICINAKGDVTVWNPQAEKIFGWAEGEVMGKLLSEIIIPNRLREAHDRGMARYAETGHGNLLRKPFETIAINREGIEFPIELSVVPVEQHNTHFFCAFIRDISARKAAESNLSILHQNLIEQSRKLQHSNEELEKYAYVTSHDLQEPLRMVTSFLQLLQKKYENQLDETAQKYINFAVDGAGRMKTLILDLLEFSRISSGDVEHKMIPLNLVVSKTLQSLKTAIDDSNAVIFTHDLPTIPGNEFQLLQLFQNLLSNALKYKGEEDPVIEIGVSQQEDCWQFSVKDNGVGIQSQYYDKIFVIFQRLHNKKDYEGNGIGLAICKKIVELHNGRIWVESSGAGSVFYFTLAKHLTQYQKVEIN